MSSRNTRWMRVINSSTACPSRAIPPPPSVPRVAPPAPMGRVTAPLDRVYAAAASLAPVFFFLRGQRELQRSRAHGFQFHTTIGADDDLPLLYVRSLYLRPAFRTLTHRTPPVASL